MSTLFVIVYVAFVAERLAEILINQRNAGWLSTQGARWVERDGFGMILAAQVILFAGLLAEVSFAAWGGEHRWTLALVLVLVLTQALRYWCIATLGSRWSIRVVTVPGAPRIARGPYRYFPHPNYIAVMTEAIVLPIAFGAWATLLVAAPLQLYALRRRIAIEERALNAASPERTPQ